MRGSKVMLGVAVRLWVIWVSLIFTILVLGIVWLAKQV